MKVFEESRPMLDNQALQELLHYTSPDPILSVYLDTDLTQGNVNEFELNLRSLLKAVDMPADEAAILEYYRHDRRWTGRSVAMFSCVPQSFFRAFPFAVPVRSRAFVSNQPYVKPLADLMDAYGSYAVVLIDQKSARLFYSHLGELKEHEGILGEQIHHTKRGGASSFPGRRGGIAGRTRHTEETVDRNIKDAIEFAIAFFEQNHVRHVLLGGTEENVRQFQSHLSKAWQKAVIGTFSMSMRAGVNDVLERALEIGAQAERQRETRVVDQMITAAAKGEAGVAGLEDTLGALREGRIQVLIATDGYRAAGFQCQGCGFLTTQTLAACPYCGKPFNKIEDAVELAVREVMKSGGEIEFVRENPKLEEVEIGALLRY